MRMYSTKFQVSQSQLLQAQQERMMILSELEQVKQMQVQFKSQLDQVLLLVKPLEKLQLFDPSILQSQLREIQAQLIKAQEERSHLQDQILAKLNKERSQELASIQAQLSDVHTSLQQTQKEQQQLQKTLLSELPLQISQLVKDEFRKLQLQTKIAQKVVPASVADFEHSSAQDELPSSQEINYKQLRDLLAAGSWEEADQETKFIMLKLTNIEQKAKFEPEDWQNLACEYLRGIDKLWLKYSKGHFGFTVQKRIFEKVGGKPGVDDYKAYCRFGEEVGWLVKNHWLSERNLKFSLNAPAGHLPIAPFLPLIRGIRSKKLYFCDFLSRLETCQQ